MIEQNIIESEEYVDYKPPYDVNINDSGKTFLITLYNENIKSCPNRSYLVFNGKITMKKKSDGVITNTIDTKKVKVGNILHEFTAINYLIGPNIVDSIENPGISTVMKGIISFEDDIRYNNACWRVNDENNNVLNDKGYFSIYIPLSIIFGFCEDHTGFIYRIQQALQLVRSSTGNCNNSLIVEEKLSEDYTFTLKFDEIIWRIPQYKFSLEIEQKINEEILTDTDYEIHFRHWMYLNKSYITGKTFTWDIPTSYYKPRHILIAFQKNRQDKINIDNGKFDLCNLENVQVTLNNNVHYPANRLNIHVDEYKDSGLYDIMFKGFQYAYYGKEGKPLIGKAEFLRDYSIIHIDCSKQDEVIKGSTINVKISFQWWDLFAIDSVIHSLIITEDRVRYNPLKNTVVIH